MGGADQHHNDNIKNHDTNPDQHHNDNIENHDTNESNENCDGRVVPAANWDRIRNNVKVFLLLLLFFSIYV